jgi:integrase
MSVLTVREVLDLYVRHSKAEGVHGEEAAADRDYVFGLFRNAYGPMPVADCRPYHLTDFIETHPEWRSVGTRRAKANMIRAAFNWAFKQERIPRHPFINIRYGEAERRPELPDDVLDTASGVANKGLERALRFLRLTGCRASELCAAVWADVDLDRGIWSIPKHKSRKHTGKLKMVALVPEAVDLLRAALAQAKPVSTQEWSAASPILLTVRGKRWSRHNLWKSMSYLKRRYGLKTSASIHGLRHAFATAAVAAGAPIALIAAQLGHANTRVTEKHYVDLTNQMDAIRAAASLGVPKMST